MQHLSSSAQQGAAGNTPAAEQLYRLHAPLILAYLRLHLSSREEAEDLLLDAFLTALQEPALLSTSVERQRAWLRSVAHHKLVDTYRRNGRRPLVPLDEVTEELYEDERRLPEQVALRHEEEARVAALLERLSALQRQTLRLRFIYGLNCAEIASLQGKNEGAVRRLLAHALNAIRTLYSEE